MEKYHINFWYKQSDCLLTSQELSLTNECSYQFLQHHPQLSPPLLVQFLQICTPLPTLNILDTWAGQVKRGETTKNHHILGATKLEVHFQNFSEVLTRASCGGTIYLGITTEEYHIFYGLIILLQGIFYSLLNLLQHKGKIMIPF